MYKRTNNVLSWGLSVPLKPLLLSKNEKQEPKLEFPDLNEQGGLNSDVPLIKNSPLRNPVRTLCVPARWGSPEDSLPGGRSSEAARGNPPASVWPPSCGRLGSCSPHRYPEENQDGPTWDPELENIHRNIKQCGFSFQCSSSHKIWSGH